MTIEKLTADKSTGSQLVSSVNGLIDAASMVTTASRFEATIHPTYLGNGTSLDLTRYIKLEAEAPFSALRIRFYNMDSPTCTVKASIAPTSIRSNNTGDLDRLRPSRGGAPDTTLWQRLKFDGEVVGNMSEGSTIFPTEVISDWIDIDSVDADDNGRPLLLVRVYNDGASTDFTTVKATPYNDWRASSGESWYRMLDSGLITNVDDTSGINNPAVPYNNGNCFMSVEFKYKTHAESCYGVGDSITAGGSTPLTGGFDTWGLTAVYSKSTTEKPFVYFNGGASGRNSNIYKQLFEQDVNSGMRPTLVTVPAYSPNDSATSFAAVQQNFIDICELAQSIGAKVFVWTSLPVDGWSAAEQEDLQAMNTYVRDNAAANGWVIMEFNGALGDAATPQRFKAGMGEDGIHPSVAGSEIMGDIFRAALDSEYD